MTAAQADPAIVLPQLPDPWTPRTTGAGHLLLVAPGCDRWPRPELVRSLIAVDDLLPLREEESLLRARNLIAAGGVTEGEALLRALAELAPEPALRAQAWIDLGRSLHQRGELEQAGLAFERAQAVWPGPESWRLEVWRAHASLERGGPQRAARMLEEAAAEAPPSRQRAQLRHWAGWLYAGEGKLEPARAAWRAALSDARGEEAMADSLHLDLAEAHVADRQWVEALRHLRALKRPEATSARSQFLRGRALFETGADDSAEAALHELLARWPDAPVAWTDEARVILGWLALERGETTEALELYRGVRGERVDERQRSRYGAALALIGAEGFADAESLLAPAAPVARDHPLFYPWTYALAYARFHLDRYEEAIEALEGFRGLVSADSLAREAWSLRGDCYYRLGAAEEAYAAYTKATTLLPQAPEGLLRRQALAAVAAEQWGTAARLLGDLIIKYPGTRNAGEYNFWRAEAFYRLNHLEMARRHYRRALQQGADPARCTYALGWCDYEEQRYASALEQFDQALRFCRDCPFAADLWLRRGNCLFNVGRIDDAAQSFAEAERRAAADSLADLQAEATFRHAWALLRLGEFAEARSAFMRIRSRAGDSPQAARALYWEGMTFFRQELYDQAVERFAAVLDARAAPDSLRARTYLGLGDGTYNLGDYAKAIEWYRRILEAPGADRALRRTAHESLFECRIALGEYDQAMSVLRDMESRFPETQGQGERHLQLAEGYLREERFASALESFGRFLERARADDPRLPHVRFQMARCREALGQRDLAAAAYEALGEEASFRQRAEALLRAGVLRLELGQPRSALRPLELRLSLQLDPAQAALTRANLAQAYQELGEDEAARNEWEKVASAASGAPDSLRAVASLNLGRMAFEEREWQAAYESFALADSLSVSAAVFRPQYWAGEAALRAGDTTGAVRWLEVFLQRSGEEPLWEATARLRLAECYVGGGRFDDARRQYEAVLELPLEEETLRDEARYRLRRLEQDPRNR